MAQSLVKNYLHIIYSTKERKQYIDDEIENELFNYIGGTCKKLDCQPITVGGYLDHVHILCQLSKKITLIKLVEEVKTHSSSWIKTKDTRFKDFYWQSGYGAFSVTPSEIDKLIDYIQNQKQHHQKRSFQDEYRLILKRCGVEFDERYVWD
jgi:putative transposase